MISAVLRVDGSADLGLGHVMRCLAVADGLRDRGVRPVFVSRSDGPGTAAVYERGYTLVPLHPEAQWEEDAAMTVQVIREERARLVVTDLCHFGALAQRPALDHFHATMLAEPTFTVCLAGGDLLDLSAHMIVSPYFRVGGPALPGFRGRIYLFGPQYFIFRKEFANAAQSKRTIGAKATRILVVIGGSDRHQITSKVLRALSGVSHELEIRVALGPAAAIQLRDEVDGLLEALPRRGTRLSSGADLAAQMVWADLAVIGDGLTKYEAAVTGTPSVMLSGPHSEDHLNAQFVEAGTTLHAGDGSSQSEAELRETIMRVLGDRALRASMSERGRLLVDGQGLQRVFERIPRVVWN